MPQPTPSTPPTQTHARPVAILAPWRAPALPPPALLTTCPADRHPLCHLPQASAQAGEQAREAREQAAQMKLVVEAAQREAATAQGYAQSMRELADEAKQQAQVQAQAQALAAAQKEAEASRRSSVGVAGEVEAVLERVAGATLERVASECERRAEYERAIVEHENGENGETPRGQEGAGVSRDPAAGVLSTRAVGEGGGG